MRIPDWQQLTLDDGILREPVLDKKDLAVWLPGDTNGEFQHWERIGNVAGAKVEINHGICTLSAVSIRVRRRLLGFVAKILQRFRGHAGGQTWILPNGDSAEQCGERKTNLLLAWPEDATASLDEAAIKAHWPECEQVQQLGKNLFVVRGVQPPEASPSAGAAPSAAEVSAESQPREIAEQALAAARQAGDRQKQAAALTDLGILTLNSGDAQRAAKSLQEALAIVQESGDRSREGDVLGNLGSANLANGDLRQAFDLFQQELSLARTASDPFAEKIALEHLGLVHARQQDFPTAIRFFDQALTLTRKLGDQRQEVTLLWHLAILHGELRQRDQAIAYAEASVALMRQKGKPEASWYADHLSKYRAGETTNGLPAASAAPSGSFVASTWTTQPTQETARQPSFLRMAVTATKAMAKFVGSGGKKVTPELRQARLRTCSTCEHHTGLRCRLCGCFTGTKSWLPYEDCPLKKWPRLLADG